MEENHTIEEVILELMPFSQELIDWCKAHPEFLGALKNVYPEKFISPAVIMLSYPPTGDEVLGVYSYHHTLGNPIFKQDFIVNKGRADTEFTLYTRNPAGSSKYVKDIGEFFAKFGQYGYKKDDHHLTLEELPPQIQERAKAAIKLAERMSEGIPQDITQAHINKIYKQVMEIKTKDRSTIEKLKL